MAEIGRLIKRWWYFNFLYWWKSMGMERHLCPLRETVYSSITREITYDYWRNQGKDRCCSFCGSWHPEEFVAFCDEIIKTNGVIGTIDLNDSRDKIYIHRPGISNCDDGAIKFKLAHIDEKDIDKANHALKISRRIWRKQVLGRTNRDSKKTQAWIKRWRKQS